MKQINHLLCGHNPEEIIISGSKARCSLCKSFWDLDYCNHDFHYDSNYPEIRHHFDEGVGNLKVKTLKSWLKKSSISTSNLIICEVGFGGGACLKYLTENSRKTYGIELLDANLTHAKNIGIENVYDFFNLPTQFKDKIDLWIFQDSFEHILTPRDFVCWMGKNSSLNARILLVLPRAASLSEKLLGKFWLHKVEDHQFHWSLKGIIGFFKDYGFNLLFRFYPLKYISILTVISHIFVKFRFKFLLDLKFSKLSMISFPFNFGEMAILLERYNIDEA